MNNPDHISESLEFFLFKILKLVAEDGRLPESRVIGASTTTGAVDLLLPHSRLHSSALPHHQIRATGHQHQQSSCHAPNIYNVVRTGVNTLPRVLDQMYSKSHTG
jgi:hypothetical protein